MHSIVILTHYTVTTKCNELFYDLFMTVNPPFKTMLKVFHQQIVYSHHSIVVLQRLQRVALLSLNEFVFAYGLLVNYH